MTRSEFSRAVEAEIKLAEADMKRDFSRRMGESLAAMFSRGFVGLAPFLEREFLDSTCTFCDQPKAHETSRCEEHMDLPCSHCGDPCCGYDEDC